MINLCFFKTFQISKNVIFIFDNFSETLSNGASPNIHAVFHNKRTLIEMAGESWKRTVGVP